MNLSTITDQFVSELAALRFAPPVTHVYNPLCYARTVHNAYLDRYGQGSREILLLGMNPGPFGMAQTGVPFGEVGFVRDWLGLCGSVSTPRKMHPKRPVLGFSCRRSEVSGARVWGWARDRFHTPERFFERFYVANYCPLIFLEESGRNRTPDHLPPCERVRLFEICDRALRATVEALQPRLAIGVGRFAEMRLHRALQQSSCTVATVPHPSPANPRANLGWATLMDQTLERLGVL